MTLVDSDGWVYALCYGEPYPIRKGDVRGSVRHYVGHTRQVPPIKRVMEHGKSQHRFLVLLTPGTLDDEESLKLTGTCPLCREPFEYRTAENQPWLHGIEGASTDG